MVHYLAENDRGIERYAETKQGVTDIPSGASKWQGEYAELDKVHPSALKDNLSVRRQGYWLKPESMPGHYLWANGQRPLPDVLPGFVVSSRFQALIEEFEPGVHQFIPVSIHRSAKDDPVATYHWFIVGQRLDSVDREHTTCKWKLRSSDPSDGYWADSEIDLQTLDIVRIPNAKMVFSNRQVEGYHIWHDPHLLTFANGLCSDRFARAVVEAGISGIHATPRESV